MASITIRNIPDALLARLRQQAGEGNRSIDGEIVRILDMSLSGDEPSRPLECHRSLADTQAQAWARLGGRWISDVPIEDEIARIYSARSGGREIEL